MLSVITFCCLLANQHTAHAAITGLPASLANRYDVSWVVAVTAQVTLATPAQPTK
ncbi:MAG: hypothetical protein WCJ56_12720 [bacterium]